MTLKKTIIISFLLTSLPFFANSNDFNYSGFGISYSDSKVKDLDLNQKQFSLFFQNELYNDFYFSSYYQYTDADDINFHSNTLSLGIGHHQSLTNRTDIYYGLEYMKAFYNSPYYNQPNIKDTNEGFLINTGLRYKLTKYIEVNYKHTYSELTEDSFNSIGARVYLTNRFYYTVDYSFYTNGTNFNIGFDF